jgi:hypothetical protein|tara:strand:- start:166 stop:900 length:735 start_codon:yes stop_codon:yes gene_type:complete
MLYSDKIVWLVSYPKSGNTWVRAFLSSYLFSKNGEFEFLLLHNIVKFPKYRLFPDCITEPENINIRNFLNVNYIDDQKNLKGIYKTHNMYNKEFTNKNLTSGFIYISRNIKDIIISFSHHYNCSVDEAIDLAIIHQKKHYDSWKKFIDVPSLYITYEDLIQNCKKEFIKILKFLKVSINNKKLEESIKNTNFKTLQTLERKRGFFEAADYKTENEKIFFRNGKVNQWENVFTIKQQERIASLLR